MKVNTAALNELVQEKYLKFQKHPSLDLFIYNYSEKAQYDKNWNEYTMLCRGLVTDSQGNIIARPFPKFFNLEEHINLMGKLPDEPFHVYDKMDGSLIILFNYQGKLQVASRGSFISDQSQKARNIIRQKYPSLGSNIKDNQTYLCEVIYQENRIVIDYGGIEDLYLLAIIDNETGKDLSLVDIGLPLVKKFEHVGGFKELPQLPNTEGYVLHFNSGLRVKIKNEEYLRLHRLVTQTTQKDIWESLKNGDSIEDLLKDVPDEFYQWLNSCVTELRANYKTIEDDAKKAFNQIDTTQTRKDCAMQILKAQVHLQPVLFSMLSGKDYSTIIWKQLKPRSETFKVDADELIADENETTSNPFKTVSISRARQEQNKGTTPSLEL